MQASPWPSPSTHMPRYKRCQSHFAQGSLNTSWRTQAAAVRRCYSFGPRTSWLQRSTHARSGQRSDSVTTQLLQDDAQQANSRGKQLRWLYKRSTILGPCGTPDSATSLEYKLLTDHKGHRCTNNQMSFTSSRTTRS